MNNDPLLTTDDTLQIEDSDTQALPSGNDLAAQALGQSLSEDSAAVANMGGDQDELAQSNKLADTITALQNIVERSANELEKIASNLKQKRDSLKSVFENDTTLAAAQEQVAALSTEVKERRSKLQADPQVTSLKVQIGELNEQKKEIEEALSNHLVNYYQLTNSKSFDTSDGDQWDFDIRAKVKPRHKSKDE